MSGAQQPDGGVTYRPLSDSYQPPEEHTSIGDGEYLAPDGQHVDALEEADKIEVLSWEDTDDTTTFAGPPEPVIQDDGPPAVVHPTDDGTAISKTELGTWVCDRCGSVTEIGMVDGELQKPHDCPNCERQGPFRHKTIEQQDVETARRAADTWFPPSEVTDSDFEGLWGDVRSYIERHWDTNDPAIYEGLTAFALSTWVREAQDFLPHLMIMGKTTDGKTRMLNTLARVSYRAIVSASATPASLFRLIDGYDTTYFISEYHGLDPDSRRELDNIVRAGQKRGEKVTRAEQGSSGGHEPEVFDPFSHIAVATQYTPDDDIINRCVQIRSSSADRSMPATFDEERALQIRNRLLYGRYSLLESEEWAAAERAAYQHLADEGIEGRTREKLLGMLTVAHVWDRVDEFEPFIEEVQQQDIEAAADSEDALVVEAIRDLAFEEVGKTTVIGDADPFSGVEIQLSEIAERYEDMTGIERSASWVGHVRERMGLEKARRRDGTVIQDDDLRPKLQSLCEDHNLDWERLKSHEDVKELPEEDVVGQGHCPQCGRDRAITHKEMETGDRICSDCADEI